MSAVLKKSTPGKIAYACHFQQIGINATKIEKTGIHFKTDVFAAVAVVDAKAPYWRNLTHLPTEVNRLYFGFFISVSEAMEDTRSSKRASRLRLVCLGRGFMISYDVKGFK